MATSYSIAQQQVQQARVRHRVDDLEPAVAGHVERGDGLFRVMTTQRPEIVIEGSRDGVNWTEYPFRWKPG